MDFIAFLQRQQRFSQRAFGPHPRLEGVLRHCEKEIAEIREAPGDSSEWADLILLAVDGAMRAGFSPQEVAQALENKLSVNEQRDWPDWRQVAGDQPIEHRR